MPPEGDSAGASEGRSARIFAIVNQKGGTGKTTVTMNLAGGLAKRGRTLVIDADPQGSATQWARMSQRLGNGGRRFPASVIAVAGPIDREVAEFSADFSCIVVDCPPTLETDAVAQVLRAAHHVIIPVLPSPVDLWGSVRMHRHLEDAQRFNPRLRANILVNQLEPRSALSREMEQALAEMAIPTLSASLRRRAIYRRAALEGTSVYALGRSAASAVDECEAVIEEVWS
ncbi:MAG: ParA family partition ATPase [Thioalkalivibrionaceae bacterium]